MNETSYQVSPHIQRCVNDITAHLARAAKEPADLQSYLRIHAECLVQALAPRGFSYGMLGGAGFQTVLERNIADLSAVSPHAEEQADSFRRAVAQVAAGGQPMIVAANSRPASALRGLELADAPAPEELPVFNLTAFEQFFIPIPLNKKIIGVLQVWFAPEPTAAANAEIRQQRLAVLVSVCAEIELYFKARRGVDLAQELTRLTTFTHLLQELAGDVDLQSVGWNVVNYAREAVDCERVSLFVAERLATGSRLRPPAEDGPAYELQASSGLQKAHTRSEHAVTLARLARRLVALSRVSAAPEENAPATTTQIAVTNETTPAANPPPATSAEQASAGADEGAPPALAASAPPRYRLTLTQRDPSKTDSRPPEINEYFDLMPMNWALALPLHDRQDRPCGILLFEGHQLPKNPQGSFEHMRELSVAIGRSVATAAHRQQSRWMRAAGSLETTTTRWSATPRRRLAARFLMPLTALVAAMFIPLQMNIKGNAQVRPVTYQVLPAMVSGRIIDLPAHAGQRVKEGEVLCRLDSYETETRLQQARQDYKRALAEADLAMSARNEAQMQIARLSADKAMASVEKFQYDLDQCTIRAPYDGIVIGPQDLAQRLGRVAAVGEPVVEVAKPTAWEVKVLLREEDVAWLGDKMAADRKPVDVDLKLAANPGQTYHLRLDNREQLAAGSEVVDGKYLFHLVLPLEVSAEEGERLKVGFGGQAAFRSGVHPLYYVWFRDFANFLKVHFF